MDKTISIGVLLLATGCLFHALEDNKQDKILEENLRDIDQRITALEQSQCITDSALVVALQSANEALYEIKTK